MSQVQMQFDAKTKQYSLTGLPNDSDLSDLDELIGDFEADEILQCLNHSLTVTELTEAEGHKIANLFNSAKSAVDGSKAIIDWMTQNHPDLMDGHAGDGITS